MNEEGKQIKITVKYLVNLADKTGKRNESVSLDPGTTLQWLSDWLFDSYGIDTGDPMIMTVLNGKGWEQYPEKYETRLQDGDTVLLLPPIAGG